jgi:superfamily II DNA or RNA helicase
MQIIKTNKQEIHGLSQEQREKIKEALTFNNPAYANAKRYSRYKYISIPPYLNYYEEKSVRSEEGERKKVLTVPIGTNIPSILNTKISDLIDLREDKPTIYPPFLLDLRNDQNKAEKVYLDGVQNEENPKCIIQLPTGKGKSILALHIAKTLGQKTLILVHKDDLVVGWKKDIKLCFGDIDCGLIKAKNRKVGEQITIATVQTLSRMDEEELSTYTNQFGLVVQDEVHHCGLNIFNVIDKFNSKYKLGLSATPTRTDGLNFVFDLFFGGICYRHEVTEDDEDICNVQVIPLNSPYEYKPFIHQGEIFNYCDYDPKTLPDNLKLVEEIPYKDRPKISYLTIDNEAVRAKQTKIMVCKKIVEHYRAGHSVIALFTQKEHINIYRTYLKQFIPENQIMLYYGDAKEDSAVLMKKAENKEVLVTLATYAKATEGTNVKSWEVEFLVSSLNNEKNVEQATGRIRRRKEGKLNPVLVYDVRYNKCYSLRSHYSTRQKTYTRLKYIIQSDNKGSKSMFTRGYSN